eukprot:515301-Karenia_brevis.AAC.1
MLSDAYKAYMAAAIPIKRKPGTAEETTPAAKARSEATGSADAVGSGQLLGATSKAEPLTKPEA